MRRLMLFTVAALLSTPLWAMHCPQEMAKIDQQLQADPPADPALLERVQSLRAEGEELHEAGKHAESLEKLNEALGLLEA
ncbi:hypothetical protein JQR85_15150 [Stutzerimonas urumqiensis]|uniref:hypothetical protein n=1 Tax=Stutzerimonas urumqiensis TaxID=638269 RepID=UPI000EB261CB|nr:hypothetical protein [Stutzerimonas urumqiensis]